MLGNTYEKQNCSAARTLEIVGERWSLLILRDALFRDMTRFSDFDRSLDIAPNILTRRLEAFVAAGLLERQTDSGEAGPVRYVPTKKGIELKPVIIALTEWGDRWAAPDGPPVVFEHEDCHGRVALHLQCAKCKSFLSASAVQAVPNNARSRHKRHRG